VRQGRTEHRPQVLHGARGGDLSAACAYCAAPPPLGSTPGVLGLNAALTRLPNAVDPPLHVANAESIKAPGSAEPPAALRAALRAVLGRAARRKRQYSESPQAGLPLLCSGIRRIRRFGSYVERHAPGLVPYTVYLCPPFVHAAW
jgi:hypothetical protein